MSVFFYKTFGMDIYFFLNCFFMYSFFGWIFECIVISYEEKRPVNRGFIRGPLCTIYGAGALGVYFLLQPIAEHKVLLFIVGAVLATIFEMFVAWLMTKLFGYFWWDYNNKPFNYKGVICLESTLCWGAMTTLTFVFFQPFVERLVNTYYAQYGKVVAVAVLALYCIDFSTSFYKALNEKENKTLEDEYIEAEEQYQKI